MDEHDAREARRIKAILKLECGISIADRNMDDCCVCQKMIKTGQKYRDLSPDENNHQARVYHEACGPGSEAWFKWHPSEVSELLFKGTLEKEKKTKARLQNWAKTRQREGLSLNRRSVPAPVKVPHEAPPTLNRRTRKKDYGGSLFKPGSKTEEVYNLLRKGVTLDDLVAYLTRKYGMKTGDVTNVKLYIKNIQRITPVTLKGDKYFA